MHVTHRSRRGNARGYTLIEVLVALALGAGVAATVAWFQRSQFLAMEEQAQQLDVQNTARAVVDLFSRDVRRAGMDPNCSGAIAPLVTASPTQVRLQADLNANGALDATEDLTYRLVNNQRVERQAGPTTETLLDDVNLFGSRFRYYDGAGNELVPWFGQLTSGQRASARRVRLEFVAQRQPHSGRRSAPVAARAATDVELRNRFFIATTTCP